MARISRKAGQLHSLEPTIARQWNVALYARLSADDEGSGSIEHQIILMNQYVSTHFDLKAVRTFSDNGETGTNFNRPAWKSLMEAIHRKEVNCIIVKDFSRFGRNYLETGTYLESVFPFLDVRFISVNDQFDSLTMSASDLSTSVKSILHDSYAKDISAKIISSLDIKRKSGKFMNKMPPYGYIRDEHNRYQLIVCEEQAKVVRQIFQWRLEGKGVSAIARRLNDSNIDCIANIWFKQGYSEGNQHSAWHGSSVSALLQNHCYIGCLVARKYKPAPRPKVVGELLPRSQWELIYDTHEAIIDEGTFYQVEEMIEDSKLLHKVERAKNNARKRTENILSGIVYCGYCGHHLQRDGGYYGTDGELIRHRFHCHQRYRKENGCPATSVEEDVLLDVVFQLCQKQIALLVELSLLQKEELEHRQQQERANQREQHQIQANLRRQHKKQAEYYAAYKNGSMTKDRYEYAVKKMHQQSEDDEKRLESLGKREPMVSPIQHHFEWLSDCQRFDGLQHLTKELCAYMIRRVTVTGCNIQVQFNYEDEIYAFFDNLEEVNAV
ncbi:MAG: recombinase family protein [Rikenellaceae bacterium]